MELVDQVDSNDVAGQHDGWLVALAKPRQLSDAEWNQHKDTLHRLYIQENRKLTDVLEIMRSEHSLSFTPRQLTKRFSKWQFRKNAPYGVNRRLISARAFGSPRHRGVGVDRTSRASSISVPPTNQEADITSLGHLTGSSAGQIGPIDDTSVGVLSDTSSMRDTPSSTWISSSIGNGNTTCSSSMRSPMIVTPAESDLPLIQGDPGLIVDPTDMPALEDHEASLLRRLFSALCLVPPDDPSIFYQPPQQSRRMIEVSDTVSPDLLLDVDHANDNPLRNSTEVIMRPPKRDARTACSAFKFPHVDAIFASTEIVPANPLEFELYPFPAFEEESDSRAVLTSASKHQDMLQKEIENCIQTSKMIEFASLGHTDAAVTLLERLAVAHFALGHYNDAEKVFHEVLPAAERLHGADSVYFLSLKRDLTAAIMHLGRYPEANQLAQEVYSSALRLDKPGGHLVQRTMHVLAQSYGNLRQLDNENDLLTQLIQIKLVESGPRDANTLSAIRSLCDSLLDAQRHADCEELLRIAIQLSQGSQGLSDKRRCLLHRKLATVLFKQGKYGESEAMYRSTAELSEQLLGAEHPDTLRCRFWLSKVLRSLGRLEESYATHLPTVEKQIETRGELRPSTIESMASFSVLLTEMESMVEAEKWMRRALRCSHQNGLMPNEHITKFWCDVDVSLTNSGSQSLDLVLELFENMACEIATLAGPGSRTNDEMMKWDHKDRRAS